MTHHQYMHEALTEARRAYQADEVPIGCIIVHENSIIARASNERNTRKNTLYHAEITAIGTACEALGDWRLDNCTLYVTIEPCPMCAGAIIQARVPIVVYGAANPKAGCAGSILNILNEPRFNHRPQVIPGILAEECGALMSDFFTRFRIK
jgi:tRNA(adenine34) deaminase